MEQIATSVSNFFASEDPLADTRLVVVWAVVASCGYVGISQQN
jgi:hypothetical protein